MRSMRSEEGLFTANRAWALAALPVAVDGQELPDSLEFQMFGGEYYPDRIEDWRRHNVDTIISMLSAAIKKEKPWVKFGISPFGVWRNRLIWLTCWCRGLPCW